MSKSTVRLAREVMSLVTTEKNMCGLCRKAGVTYFRFHALRHSGASLMKFSNIPIGSIQRILGHENRATTEIYLHSVGNSEIKAIQEV